jgi:NADH-quinone oxidoreductase subunit C
VNDVREIEVASWRVAAQQALADGYDYLDWLSAVDEQEDGLRLVLHLLSLAQPGSLTLTTLVPTDGSVPSVTEVFAGAGWHERETAEMFGVTFEGLADSRPLMLADDFAGHPLRKDFVLGARAVKAWPGLVDPTPRGRRPPAPVGQPGSGWPPPLPSETVAPDPERPA